MLLIVGYVVILVGVLGGFIMAGGKPILLLHLSEFVVIGGTALGVLIIASPKSVMINIINDIKTNIGSGPPGKEDYLDLAKLLYEMFMLGRRNGLIALDEHLSEPHNSSLMTKYPGFLKDHHRVEFLCNALRPIVDGKLKPEQLEKVLDDELYAHEVEAHGGVDVMTLVGDSLPGIGIVAAVLGIINTMSAISEGPEVVGEKVSAALTGTFLGVLFAYGFINPLIKKIQFTHKGHTLYFQVMSGAIVNFAKGLAPMMAIEIARRSFPSDLKPASEELETMLKSLGSG